MFVLSTIDAAARIIRIQVEERIDGSVRQTESMFP